MSKVNNSIIAGNDSWNGQRGAALVTTIMASLLLLTVSGALILTTSLATTTAIDSTSELQAYYAAEAGVNAAINVVRGNVASSPTGTQATFRNLVSNPSLNNWLTYNTSISGAAAVSLNPNPVMGYAINISDPDNTPVANQPRRLLLQVTGHGPRGSRKQIELIVDRYLFDYSPLATILMRGNDDNSTPLPTFAIGNSNAKTYSGYDNANPSSSIPVFGTTHNNDFNVVTNEINSAKPNTVSGVDKVKKYNNSELPAFLQTADNARQFLNSLQGTAAASGRYFTSTPASFGTTANPQITFVDGDCDLSGGAGLLVVTGTLSLHGNVSFDGLILVLGKGVMTRAGGGGGDILGSIVIAKFARNWPAEENGMDHPFLSPTYDTNGGGNSTVAYDSNRLDSALGLGGARTKGVREF